ncbi:MAG: trypsin-like peptidase domain-containing protein [Myxococcota bacterium]
MAITIHAQWGPEESGRVLFDGSIAEPVTVGRATDNAVALSSPSVGSYHLSLVEDDGKVYVDVLDHQPVYLVGGDAPTRWTGRHTLFEDGGSVTLDLGFPIDPDHASDPGFDEQGAVRLVIQDRKARGLLRPERTERRREASGNRRGESSRNLLALMGTILLTGGGLYSVTAEGFDRLSEGQRELAEKTEEVRVQGVRIESLVERNLALAQETFTADFVVSAIETPEAVRSASDAVWYLGALDPQAVVDPFEGIGTGWIIADGDVRRIVTNAHVLEQLREATEGRPVPVMRQGERTVRLAPLDDVLVHPFYDDFARLRSDVARQHWTNPYDVALLAPADASDELGRGLVIAPTPQLVSLDVPTDLHTFGFPFENLSGSQPSDDRPVPLFDRGYISQITDATGRTREPEHQHLLTVRMQATGGASGSPVLDDAGQVVGMLFGTDMLGISGDAVVGAVESQSRYRIPVGYSWVLRADVVLSMLAGRNPLDDTWWRQLQNDEGTASDELRREQAVRLKQLRRKGRCTTLGAVRPVDLRRGPDGFVGGETLDEGDWLVTVRVPDDQVDQLIKGRVVTPGPRGRTLQRERGR